MRAFVCVCASRDVSLPTYRSLVTMVMSLPLADDDDGGDDVIRAASQGSYRPSSELLPHTDLARLNKWLPS